MRWHLMVKPEAAFANSGKLALARICRPGLHGGLEKGKMPHQERDPLYAASGGRAKCLNRGEGGGLDHVRDRVSVERNAGPRCAAGADADTFGLFARHKRPMRHQRGLQ
jgi:hypothetical protein